MTCDVCPSKTLIRRVREGSWRRSTAPAEMTHSMEALALTLSRVSPVMTSLMEMAALTPSTVVTAVTGSQPAAGTTILPPVLAWTTSRQARATIGFIRDRAAGRSTAAMAMTVTKGTSRPQRPHFQSSSTMGLIFPMASKLSTSRPFRLSEAPATICLWSIAFETVERCTAAMGTIPWFSAPQRVPTCIFRWLPLAAARPARPRCGPAKPVPRGHWYQTLAVTHRQRCACFPP